MLSLKTHSGEAKLSEPTGRPPGRWERRDWQILGLLFLLAGACFIPGLGTFGLIDPSDAYYSEGAREMLEKGDWLVPLLNYQPWFQKPILNYWLIMGSYKLFGLNELAARLPAAMCGILSVASLYALSRRFLRRRSALLSALVLLSSPLYLVVGHLSLTDMPFTLATTCAALGFLALLAGASRSVVVLSYLALALAVLCKGPLAVVLTGMVAGLYMLATCRTGAQWLACLAKLRLLPGLILTAASALPWYISVSLATHGAFAREFFLNQNFGRFVGQENHHHPTVWYYLPFALGGLAPWSVSLFLMPGRLRRVRTEIRQDTLRKMIRRYSAIWLASVFILLSLVPTKLPTYILPIAPPLAILVGSSLDTAIRLRKPGPLIWLAALMAVTSLGAFASAPRLLAHSPGLLAGTMLVLALLTVFYLLCSLYLSKQQMLRSVVVLTAATVFGTALLVPTALNGYYAFHESGLRQLLQLAGRANANLAILGPAVPSSSFYLKRPVPVLRTGQELLQYLEDGARSHWLLVARPWLEAAQATSRSCKIIEHHRWWYLVQVD